MIHSTTTTDLYISSESMDCTEVARHLQRLAVDACVQPTVSIVPENRLEQGCLVKLTNTDVQHLESKLWRPLQSSFALGCGYLHIHGVYRGCTENFFRPSCCPRSV